METNVSCGGSSTPLEIEVAIDISPHGSAQDEYGKRSADVWIAIEFWCELVSCGEWSARGCNIWKKVAKHFMVEKR